jgi:quinol-cytochrome oxidoreductase complex cytochrome b subunit
LTCAAGCSSARFTTGPHCCFLHWYIGFLDGSTRLFPSWEIRLFHHTIPPLFWPTVVLPGILFTLAGAYPFLEAKLTKHRGSHNLLQQPRDVPVRTGLGAMAITFYAVLLLSGGNDLIAKTFDISLNAMTYAGRVSLLVLRSRTGARHPERGARHIRLASPVGHILPSGSVLWMTKRNTAESTGLLTTAAR